MYVFCLLFSDVRKDPSRKHTTRSVHLITPKPNAGVDVDVDVKIQIPALLSFFRETLCAFIESDGL